MGSPFIFKFENDRKYYIYDVNSNNIFRVDKNLYKNVDQANLEDFREKGFFLEKRPKKMEFPFSKDEYKLLLYNLLRHIILNVTEDCNNRCEYCKFSGDYLYSRTHSKKYMEESLAINAIKFMIERAG